MSEALQGLDPSRDPALRSPEVGYAEGARPWADHPITIDGVAVVDKCVVLQHEWECDGWAYLTADGRVWCTSHNRMLPADESVAAFDKGLRETRAALVGMEQIAARARRR